MAKIHLLLQNAKGIGKSFIASIIAQYKLHRGKSLLCIDTDSSTYGFARYKALDVKKFSIKDGKNLEDHFNELFDSITLTKAYEDIIVDSPFSSFIPLSSHIISQKIASKLQDSGHELILHIVIVGGENFIDTLHGFSQLITQIPDGATFILWLNSYFGPIKYEGKTFEDMKVYQDNKQHISAIVPLPILKKETFGKDLANMMHEALTFNEAISLSPRMIVTKQRLKMIRDQLFRQLDTAICV